ncbi:MAG: transglycosylase domain-containing protein [Lachnospiraceae bacterium]|nr:transglycosylase domain-containing protein [Lachnospiraceae bacterium]
MNYGKKGVTEKQKDLNAKSSKWGKKIALIFLKVFLVVFISGGIIAASGAVGIIKGVIDSSPDISEMTVAPTKFSTFIYDSEGNQTAKLVASNSNRIPVSMDKIPEDLAHAFVALEDERFYEHNGIDIKGIIRAFMVGVKNKFNFSEGASTITQQLLKNIVFTDWVSEESFAEKLKRKIQEQYLAIELEKQMDKNTILVNYMNTINLGQNTLGVQAASLRYFNKQVQDLNLSECAVLAGITKNPSRYNPISHPDENAKRRTKVLNNMLEQGYISQSEYDDAMADDPYSRIKTTNEVAGDTTITSYFDDAVTEQVYEDLLAAGYNDTQAYTLLYSGGLKIYSTQDPDIQAICDEIYSNEENYPENSKWALDYRLTIKKANGETVNHSKEMYRKYFRENGKKNFNLLYSSHEDAYADIEIYQAAVLEEGDDILAESIELTPQPQVSLTVADQSTGHVVAMIGGRGTKDKSRTLNRATATTRPPGSTFKLLASFGPAIDSGGFTLASIINDAPFCYYDGTPVRNWYSNSATPYRGLMSIREGIYNSLNIVAVKTITQITPQLGFAYLENLGFSTLEVAKEINGKIYSDIQQTLSLGGLTNGVTNLELNAAYACIANGGTYIEPKLYTKVVDYDGNIILDNTTSNTRQVFKETTAYLLTNAMEDTLIRGTGTAANFKGMATAGKTGTATDDLDVWFAGYTPYYTATTWTGYDDNNTKLSGAGLSLSKTMWKKVMSAIHEDLPSKSFEAPANIVRATVCARSGKLPLPGICDGTLKTEYFEEGTVPTEACNVHYQGALCYYSNQPACTNCPFKTEGIFELPPPEHPSLLQGSSGVAATSFTGSTTSQNPDGSTTIAGSVNPDGTVNEVTVSYNYCPHTDAFMADPNKDAIIAQHRAEIEARNLAAQQAAEAAAAGQ